MQCVKEKKKKAWDTAKHACLNNQETMGSEKAKRVPLRQRQAV